MTTAFDLKCSLRSGDCILGIWVANLDVTLSLGIKFRSGCDVYSRNRQLIKIEKSLVHFTHRDYEYLIHSTPETDYWFKLLVLWLFSPISLFICRHWGFFWGFSKPSGLHIVSWEWKFNNNFKFEVDIKVRRRLWEWKVNISVVEYLKSIMIEFLHSADFVQIWVVTWLTWPYP